MEILYCEENGNASKHFIKKFTAFTNQRYRMWLCVYVEGVFLTLPSCSFVGFPLITKKGKNCKRKLCCTPIQDKFCISISNLLQSSDIAQNAHRGIPMSEFLVKSLINKNCHSSRTSNDIDNKLRAVTKFGKKNMTTS